MNYKHVLLVTDLLSDADIVAQRAKRVILGFPEAKLSVLHIVEDDLVHFGRKPVTETTLTDDDPSGQWQETREKLARFIERNDLKQHTQRSQQPSPTIKILSNTAANKTLIC